MAILPGREGVDQCLETIACRHLDDQSFHGHQETYCRIDQATMKPVRRVPILHGKERRQPKNVIHARR